MRLFARHGYRVLIARNGTAALQLLKSQPADLVLLDVRMPQMNGLQVLEAMREDPRTQELPVIVYSIAGDLSTRDKAMQLGAADYWVKGTIGFPEMIEGVRARLKAS
jgi:CheY-like chemotaxis protein